MRDLNFSTNHFGVVTSTLSSLNKYKINVDGISIDVKRFNVESTKINGEGEFTDRGPAMAVLKDGTVLLGGGKRGGSIFAWNEYNQNLKYIGDMISVNERVQGDSRFGITDIAILYENKHIAKLLVSFPKLSQLNCIEVVVFRVIYDRTNNLLKKKEMWFKSSPCVSMGYTPTSSSQSPFQSAVQHAGGRMQIINKHSAYLTIGDLGFDNLFDREKRGDLGSVFRISKKNVTRISQGHRNPQGIVLLNNKDLIVSEHGPKGGDEINIIESGVDYGWPFVTYGTEYTPDDYIIPAQTETHEGYRKPIKQWNPSIAPTELIQIPTQKFGKYSGGIAMGTLRENSLVFMRYENKNITDTEIVYIGARIRDLEVLPDKRLIASTDDGRLIIFTSPTTNK
jgi:hypothetical protein